MFRPLPTSVHFHFSSLSTFTSGVRTQSIGEVSMCHSLLALGSTPLGYASSADMIWKWSCWSIYQLFLVKPPPLLEGGRVHRVGARPAEREEGKRGRRAAGLAQRRGNEQKRRAPCDSSSKTTPGTRRTSAGVGRPQKSTAWAKPLKIDLSSSAHAGIRECNSAGTKSG